MKPARIGCSGWNYDGLARSVLPASASPSAAGWSSTPQRFDTVEVNTTFYRLPRREAVAAWVAQTPDRFTFAVKASRYLTHIRRLHGPSSGGGAVLRADRAADRGRAAGPGAVAAARQLHARRRAAARWLEALPDGLHTIEFRHPSWFVDAGDARAARARRRAHHRRPSRSARSRPTRPPPTGASSAFTTDRGAAAATTRPPSSTRGRGGSPSGAGARRCGPTSTTTGAGSRPPTPRCWRAGSASGPGRTRCGPGSPGGRSGSPARRWSTSSR